MTRVKVQHAAAADQHVGGGKRINVLVVEDHHLVRAGFVAIIDRELDMFVIGEAEDGRQAVDTYQKKHPDVVLMDLRMPDLDGVDATKAIRLLDPDARIIILTTFDGQEDIFRGLAAGAQAYLLKDARSDELLACIRDVRAGQSRINPNLLGKLARRLNGSELTPRELQVLERMSAGCGNKQIASDLHISIDTVKTHVNRTFQKLGVGSRPEAVTTAFKRGVLRPG